MELLHEMRAWFVVVPLAAGLAGCGGADVSSFGSDDGAGGSGGQGSTTGDPSGTTGATTASSTAQSASASTTTTGPGGTGSTGQTGVTASSSSGQGGAGDGGASSSSTGGDPFCGDDTCDADETCETCPQDCGTCAGGCESHADCASDELCDGGRCASAYGRSYVFTVVDAFFPLNDPSTGTTWDPVGLPDPFVQLCTQDQGCPAGTTTTQDEQNHAVWNEEFTIALDGPDAGDVWFVMWDEDVQVDDFALQTPIGTPADWVDVVRTQGGTYLYEPSVGLDLQIDVTPL